MKFKVKGDNRRFLESQSMTDGHKFMILLISEFLKESMKLSSEESRRRDTLGVSVDDTPDIRMAIVTSLALELHCKLIVSGKTQPIESMIGMIASIFTVSKDMTSVWNANQVASELIMFGSPRNIFKITRTLNGKFIVKYNFFDEKSDDEQLLFQLPNREPSKAHKALGRVRWTPTSTTALDILNRLPMTVLDIPEDIVEAPTKHSSLDYVELWKKQMVRHHMKHEFIGQPTYFDWNYDTRYRMYPSGYFFHIQGNEYEKNIIAFYNHEKCTIQGRQSIKRAIAVAFGKDKMIDEEKIAWFNENKDNLDWRLAKEPTYARAQMMSLKLVEETGMTNIPVELDEQNCVPLYSNI